MTTQDWKRLPHMYHILKGRQMGFTEIVLRLIQYFCFNRYAGKNVGIMAATNGKLAAKDLRRFSRLFRNIPHVVSQTIKSNTIKLTNGVIIEAFPASEEAVTGDTNYACIFLDESAKWKLVDDTPVFNSIMPIIRANGADLFLVSTPKGPLKMFYTIWANKEDEEFLKLEYDIWRTEGNLYTKLQIDEMISSTTGDANQEYLCKFTVSDKSIFNIVLDEDREPGMTAWDVSSVLDEADDTEDDNFVEDEEDND